MNDIQALLNGLLDSIHDAVIIADAEGNPLRSNPAFEALMGFASGSGAEVSRLAASMIYKALSPGAGGRWKGMVICPDGKERPFEVTAAAINPSADSADRFLCVVRPALAEDSHGDGGSFGYDTLTGLPNRDLFADRIGQAVLQANRTGASVALMTMGLDRFTLVNDALGHNAGDRLLVEVARRLKMCVRETDTAVRLDGDKFALVMAIADTDDSVIVAEKALHAVKEPFSLDGEEVVVTFSIGISVYPLDADSSAQLVKHAENALHYAKVSGRNQYQFFSNDMNRKAKSRLELEGRMRRALANDEFVVYYQPKVSADRNTIVGAEALIRWLDPERGMVSPGEFIPVAEESGQIEPIGTWVLRQSCQQNRLWQEAGFDPIKVSVNVSARQFRSPSLLEIVTEALDSTGLDPKWLELEITESMLMNDVDTAVRKMRALRDLGIGLSIDDFGTGYSSLSYLGRFPITTLKIDRAFIADVDTNPKTAEIARAIIGLSRGLNLEVVAEGAEIAAHIAFLRSNGCDTVQGFFYSRPVPADEFEQMMRQRIMAHA
ncbi:diguanylate cyclase/phosphodiesterase (GGDEF & EAL domains) with PAS/PAC sensor(s) [Paramagnetospirillum magnetotacticum MS-1]|uniref:Diguanylate cyclase/phosphodiesterase (GGDEF & EAL domains) with PAS/PAC sensor(S) n=1 Tax=Paramagnetospirillum magnetotacticum MS-1 TaxID=272627 RepID=A0A0C2YFY7_PARME|nr:EAL domain-containing protein [Paramagnetospirillum magnetotacticum]KIL98639.1 diguanylate cyclase/phosphodiesterase (GGDEF & EAL domains) with PAS/PAC sensor(s) [Paramagnetospirillum magnetotacticum MS-1]